MSTTLAPGGEAARSDLERARDEVIATSAGGAPFLIAFGATIGACGLLGLVLPARTAALLAMFQGTLALPLALVLERVLGRGRMAADNPLRALSVQLAMSQALALPAAFIAFSFHPATVPAALAAIAGAHFLPYSWLHRTRVYAVLGVVVSVGAFVLTVALKREALPWVLLFMSGAYAAAAVPLLRHARRHAGGARG